MEAPPFPAAAIAAARDAAKAHLRIASDDEDALVARLAATGLALCEAFTGTALILREWGETIDAVPAWRRLAVEPVRAITGVAELTPGGSVPITDHAIDIDPEDVGWVRLGRPARVRVTCQAGLSPDWAGLPPGLAQGIVLLSAHLFEQRGADAVPPAAVAALWRPFRLVRLRPRGRAA